MGSRAIYTGYIPRMPSTEPILALSWGGPSEETLHGLAEGKTLPLTSGRISCLLRGGDYMALLKI